jgi:Domain of unknown function (DUF4913)
MFTEEQPTELQFQNVAEFFHGVILPLFHRQVGPAGRAEFRWSARWWESGEAVLRLDCLWRSWEKARQEPAEGMSAWLRDHLDYHLEMLLSPHGPFANSTDANRPGEPLPAEVPPAGVFDDAVT